MIASLKAAALTPETREKNESTCDRITREQPRLGAVTSCIGGLGLIPSHDGVRKSI